MENAPHVIETALLLLVAFLVGCTIGWFFRTKVFAGSKQPTTDTPNQTAQPVQTPVSNSNASSEDATATSAPATVPKADKPEASQSKISKPKPKLKPKATAAKPAAMKDNEASGAGADANRPEALSGPRAGAKDDLKKISGIGPKLEEKLNGLGIFHFDQIVAWDRPAVEWVDNYLSFKGRIDRDDWIAQAKQFAKE